MAVFPGGLGDIFKKAQELQKEAGRIKEDAEKKTVEASAGGGMVVVRVNGVQQIVSLKIDKTLVDSGDVQMLEDLVRAAANEGLRKARDILKEELSKLTGGLPIPGL